MQHSSTFVVGVLVAAVVAGPAVAQQPSIEDLMRKIDALQHRVDELESQQKTIKTQVARSRHDTAPTTAATPASVPPVVAAAPAAPAATATAKMEPQIPTFESTVPGLLPPEPMGNQFSNEDALRSDLPGLSIRIPGTDTQVRLYGFAKLSGWYDLNARNQTDAPTAQTIPLADSRAAMQGGDFGMTARFSRVGMDTRTLTSWGRLETRIEGDFGGGSPTSNNAVFRLRQAWGELGTEEFRV